MLEKIHNKSSYRKRSQEWDNYRDQIQYFFFVALFSQSLSRMMKIERVYAIHLQEKLSVDALWKLLSVCVKNTSNFTKKNFYIFSLFSFLLYNKYNMMLAWVFFLLIQLWMSISSHGKQEEEKIKKNNTHFLRNLFILQFLFCFFFCCYSFTLPYYQHDRIYSLLWCDHIQKKNQTQQQQQKCFSIEWSVESVTSKKKKNRNFGKKKWNKMLNSIKKNREFFKPLIHKHYVIGMMED